MPDLPKKKATRRTANRLTPSEKPPEGSIANLVWGMALTLREAPHGSKLSIAALKSLKKDLRMFGKKKAADLTGIDVRKILEAADRYIADPANRVTSEERIRAVLGADWRRNELSEPLEIRPFEVTLPDPEPLELRTFNFELPDPEEKKSE